MQLSFNRFFLSIAVTMLVASSVFAKHRAACSVCTPPPPPFVVAIAVTPAVNGGTRITSHFGVVPLGTSAERQLDGQDVVPVEVFTVLGVPGDLWWMQMWEGPLPSVPSGENEADLIIRSPDGLVTHRVFAKTSSTATVADLTAPIGSVDAGGGVHLYGFRIKPPVVVLPTPNVSLNASLTDYNFVPSGQKDAYGRPIIPAVGMMVTVCDMVVDDLNPTVDTRECHTGTLVKQE
jgi:hypothetical protein